MRSDRPRSRDNRTSRIAVAAPPGPPPMIATVFPRITSLANCFPPTTIVNQAGQLTLLDIPPRQDFQRLPVFLRRLFDHVGGNLRPRRGLVPRQRQQIIADELLVEALLRAAPPGAVRRPETRTG